MGLKDDGTVVAVGDNGYGQCSVGNWTDITQIAAGVGHTVGLRSGGTVVAMGANAYGQCNVGGWTNMIQVAAGLANTVGVKADGTVVAVGGEFEFPTWNLRVIEYTLAISNTAGGSVTTPGVGNFTYDEGTVVDLVATPASWPQVCQLDRRCGYHRKRQRRRDQYHHERQLLHQGQF